MTPTWRFCFCLFHSQHFPSHFHVVCLKPNAWLESYDCYGSFDTMIWEPLIVSPVLWVLSSGNTLSVTHSDTASYLAVYTSSVLILIQCTVHYIILYTINDTLFTLYFTIYIILYIINYAHSKVVGIFFH